MQAPASSWTKSQPGSCPPCYGPKNLSALANQDTTLPFEVMVSIPADELGRMEIQAFGVNRKGTRLKATTPIIVETTESLTALEVSDDRFLFFEKGGSDVIDVSGRFAEGRKLLKNSPGLHFSSSNPAVETVDDDGGVVAVAPGVATIHVSYGALSRDVLVTVGVSEVRGDVTGDSDVDHDDLKVVRAALHTTSTGAGDPRDLNQDGRIEEQDAELLTELCSRPGCETQ